MAYSPQQKLLKVASELGITDMKNMQGTTRNLYHLVPSPAGGGNTRTFFGDELNNAPFITRTNVPSGGKLQVNEALLVEAIYFNWSNLGSPSTKQRVDNAGIADYVILVNVYVGNKRVVKDVLLNTQQNFFDGVSAAFETDTRLYLEGIGFVIPPQIEFRVEAQLFNKFSLAPVSDLPENDGIMCTLYGTGVLLNLNTSL